MSLLGTIYKSSTGLDGFTKSLDNLSNNVSNLNTPGYKGKDLYFKELVDGDSPGVGDQAGQGFSGQGVALAGASVAFSEGDVAETGERTHLAIEGNGFFVLREGDQLFFTRRGDFQLDADGFYVDPVSGRRVAALGVDGGASLRDINIGDVSLSRPEATTQVTFTGNLSSAEERVPPNEDEFVEFEVFDGLGDSRALKLEFENDPGTSGVWFVTVRDQAGNVVSSGHRLEYDSQGRPKNGFNSIELNFQPYSVLTSERIQESIVNTQEIEISDGDLSQAQATAFEIEGEVFFGLRDSDSETIEFSESGVYQFDSEGILKDIETGRTVAALNENGQISDFSISDLVTNPFVTTTKVNIAANLDSDAVVGDTFPADGAEPLSFTVIDSEGVEQTLSIVFEKDSDTRWRVEVFDADGASRADRFIVFSNGRPNSSSDDFNINVLSEDGTPSVVNIDFRDLDDFTGLSLSEADFSYEVEEVDGRLEGSISQLVFNEAGQLEITYDNEETAVGPKIALVEKTGEPLEDLKLYFGDPGTVTGTSSFASGGSESISVKEVNGRATGFLTQFDFDEQGKITYKFSNGEEVEGPTVALATFSNLNGLVAVGDTQFRAEAGAGLTLGSAGEGSFGNIAPLSLELSNVELSREFAEIIIVQRGYQASSQVLNVTNEMIEELYNTVRGR